jgi:energy-coupling factor transporter transmembrane protein EcfT
VCIIISYFDVLLLAIAGALIPDRFLRINLYCILLLLLLLLFYLCSHFYISFQPLPAIIQLLHLRFIKITEDPLNDRFILVHLLRDKEDEVGYFTREISEMDGETKLKEVSNSLKLVKNTNNHNFVDSSLLKRSRLTSEQQPAMRFVLTTIVLLVILEASSASYWWSSSASVPEVPTVASTHTEVLSQKQQSRGRLIQELAFGSSGDDDDDDDADDVDDDNDNDDDKNVSFLL